MHNAGIHFSNKYWEPPSEEDFARLRLARPDTIKTLLFSEPRFDQAAVHKRLREEHSDALIVARLYADMNGGPWPPHDFVNAFVPQMEAIRPYVTWFEVHNEPNLDHTIVGYSEGFGATDEDFGHFVGWCGEVLHLLRQQAGWAKYVFPGQAPMRYREFWRHCEGLIRKFDAMGVHCYWQNDNALHPYHGTCYKLAHQMIPDMDIIVTEFGDATFRRAPTDKIPIYLQWYKEAAHYPYLKGTALYILGGTSDWTRADINFDITREMAEAIGARENTTP